MENKNIWDYEQEPSIKCKKEKHRIVITVQGGLIQDICIPKDLQVVAEVRDYDTDGDEIKECCKDKDGELYRLSEWE